MTVTPPQLERVVLTGFMGSGKTTVGQLLAARLGWSFADLDDAVEARAGLRVPEIFKQRGEQAFRLAEVEALTRLLDRQRAVIALGGGAAATPAVRDLLKSIPRTLVIHLDAEFEVLQRRCLQQALDPSSMARPLLTDAEAARRRYRERAPLYASLAHGRIEVGALERHEVVQQIFARWPILAESVGR